MIFLRLLLVIVFVFVGAEDGQHSMSLFKNEQIKRRNTFIKFKQQLLSSLSVPPSATMDESPRQKWMQLPSFVRERLVASSLDNQVQAPIETKEIFVPVKIAQRCINKNITEPHICVNFRLDQRSLQAPIRAATLYLDLPRGLSSSSSYLIMKDLLSSNVTETFQIHNGNLLKVNINHSIIKDANEVDYIQCHFVIICSGDCKNESFTDAQLFLEVVPGKRDHRRRSKRSVADSSRTCSPDEIMCCKRSFVFRPADIGWNWIVHPEEIMLNYCMGECNDQTSNYTYSRVLSILKRSKKANLTPHQLESMKFCCAPKNYLGLNVIYLTSSNNSFQKIHLSNMIVDSCACV